MDAQNITGSSWTAEPMNTSKQDPDNSSDSDGPSKKRRLARKAPNLWLQIPHTPTTTTAPTSTPSPFLLSTPDMECLAPLENRALATPRTADVVESLVRFEADNFLKCSADLFGLDSISRPSTAGGDSRRRISIELNVAGQKVVVPLEIEVLNPSSDIPAPTELPALDDGLLGTNPSERESGAAALARSPSPANNGSSGRQREVSKRIRTREQNKIAAKSYRARKKETFQLLITANQQLQREKTELLRRVKLLETEITSLRQRLDVGSSTATAPCCTATLLSKSLAPIVSTTTSGVSVLISVGSACNRNVNAGTSTIIPVVQGSSSTIQNPAAVGQSTKRPVFILPNAPPPNSEAAPSQPVVTAANKFI